MAALEAIKTDSNSETENNIERGRESSQSRSQKRRGDDMAVWVRGATSNTGRGPVRAQVQQLEEEVREEVAKPGATKESIEKAIQTADITASLQERSEPGCFANAEGAT